MNRTIFKTIFTLLFAFYFFSCANKKDIIYFNAGTIDEKNVTNDYKLRFKCDDMLLITVISDDVESAIPFNLPLITASPLGKNVLGNPQFQSYLVDSEGYIEFPVLGRIKVAGLTRSQLISLIRDKLSPSYIKNPVINILITNFKVTVQGDVARPGTFPISNERISILDAIGLAGDLNISANRENIKVIREEGKTKTIHEINLLSKNSLTNRAYYLQQNDIVYVEPNGAKVQDSKYTRSAGLFISMASVIISLLTILTR